jgi:hypothetical protein
MTITVSDQFLRHRLVRAVAAAGLFFAFGCHGGAPTTLRTHPIDLPAPPGSMVPQTTRTSRGDVILSWLEARSDKGYRFRVAVRRADQWRSPITIDDSPDLTMFGADLPGIAELPGGQLLAYWERNDTKATEDPYATAIQLARSDDGGNTWTPLASPHRDGTSGQHSFLSAFTTRSALGLVWLDAQHQHHIHTPAHGTAPAGEEYVGAVGLRYASFAADGTQQSDAFVDPITCECCPTSAAVTARGPVVVYRDRVTALDAKPEDIRYDTPTVRDIHLVRLENGTWSAPRRVHADNWVFNACPDNGPAVDAVDNNLVVAWWTAADNQPRASVTFSTNAGETFGPAIRVDVKSAEGQVTVAAIDKGRAAIVGWLEDHQTWARWVSADGRLGTPVSLGSAPNHARLPHWIAEPDAVVATWTDETRGLKLVRMARLARP